MSHKIREFIKPGSEIGAATISAALALLGPQASILAAGGAIYFQKLLDRGCTNLYDQITGYRAKARAGHAAAYALLKIAERLNNGETVREDSFFEPKTYGRSSADELFEGVILKSSVAYEERKAVLLRRHGDSRVRDQLQEAIVGIATATIGHFQKAGLNPKKNLTRYKMPGKIANRK